MPRLAPSIPSSILRSTSLQTHTVLLVALSLGVGCVENWKGTDLDGDGFGVFEGDCWDSLEGPPGSNLTGADIRPDATENWYDGIDQNCDGIDDYDPDGDGWVKQEEHINQPTLGLPDSGINHVGAGDCYNTP
ncbi:MAG TPA: hypothetical protein DFR83_23840, partial [Deltaproteobacteria bacterium]|nr:hypothetical protein [Deltaproteobacteria bacterium]